MSVVKRTATALEAVRAAFVDADSLARTTNQEVVDLLALTAELTRVTDAQRVRLAGAIADRSHAGDETSIHRLLGARHAREAVGKAFGIRSRDAAELLSMAAATMSSVGFTGETIAIKFPRVAKALDLGELSLAQARAIVGTLSPAAPRADLKQLAWAEGCLVNEATHPDRRLAPELLVTQAQAYVAVLDPDGVLPNSERQRAMRSLRMRQLPDGMWELVLRCTPETAAAIKAVLDASTAPRVSVRFMDLPADEGDDDERTDESADELDGHTGGDVDDQPDAELDPAADAADTTIMADDRTREQKCHDVLVAIVEAHAAAGGAPLAGGEVPRLVFTGTIDAYNAYLQGIDHPDRSLTIEHTGAIVPIETADRLLCNAVVQRAVVDTKGHVLELGRTQRTFNRAQRRALAAQYGGCATPGCGMPVAWTEAHHVQWWENDGPTDTANGILLCSHCHHEVHAGRLLVVGTTGDWCVVPQLRPAGRYARNPRTGTPLLMPTGARTTAAAEAAASLAVKLPETAAPLGHELSLTAIETAPAVRRPRQRPRSGPGPIEARLRSRSAVERRRSASMRAIDFLHPTRHVVLRT